MADVYGTTGNDTLYGSTSDDQIYGFAGQDTIYGFGGNDNIYAGANGDVVYGGAGDDFIVGGTGWDFLTGGAGLDNFVFDADTMTNGDHDFIPDWDDDYISLYASPTYYDYDVYDSNGDQVPDGIRILTSAANDGTADAMIDLVGVGFVGEPSFSSSWILGGTPVELA